MKINGWKRVRKFPHSDHRGPGLRRTFTSKKSAIRFGERANFHNSFMWAASQSGFVQIFTSHILLLKKCWCYFSVADEIPCLVWTYFPEGRRASNITFGVDHTTHPTHTRIRSSSKVLNNGCVFVMIPLVTLRQVDVKHLQFQLRRKLQ